MTGLLSLQVSLCFVGLVDCVLSTSVTRRKVLAVGGDKDFTDPGNCVPVIVNLYSPSSRETNNKVLSTFA